MIAALRHVTIHGVGQGDPRFLVRLYLLAVTFRKYILCDEILDDWNRTMSLGAFSHHVLGITTNPTALGLIIANFWENACDGEPYVWDVNSSARCRPPPRPWCLDPSQRVEADPCYDVLMTGRLVQDWNDGLGNETVVLEAGEEVSMMSRAYSHWTDELGGRVPIRKHSRKANVLVPSNLIIWTRGQVRTCAKRDHEDIHIAMSFGTEKWCSCLVPYKCHHLFGKLDDSIHPMDVALACGFPVSLHMH
ncbi:hypothetical protein GGR57DRAFT_278145 [Xylariaceae sp. FL1272]|nr:hypothetical protein GGR57DRAFT_278145 [Xylariaceae sp. FL1272]